MSKMREAFPLQVNGHGSFGPSFVLEFQAAVAPRHSLKSRREEGGRLKSADVEGAVIGARHPSPSTSASTIGPGGRGMKGAGGTNVPATRAQGGHGEERGPASSAVPLDRLYSTTW